MILTGQNVLTPELYWILKLYFSIGLYISFNAAVTAFESGFTKHSGVEFKNLALVGFLCNLGVQYKLGSFLFISLTSRLNSFFRNDLLSDIIFSTALIAFLSLVL